MHEPKEEAHFHFASYIWENARQCGLVYTRESCKDPLMGMFSWGNQKDKKEQEGIKIIN